MNTNFAWSTIGKDGKVFLYHNRLYRCGRENKSSSVVHIYSFKSSSRSTILFQVYLPDSIGSQYFKQYSVRSCGSSWCQVLAERYLTGENARFSVFRRKLRTFRAFSTAGNFMRESDTKDSDNFG